MKSSSIQKSPLVLVVVFGALLAACAEGSPGGGGGATGEGSGGSSTPAGTGGSTTPAGTGGATTAGTGGATVVGSGGSAPAGTGGATGAGTGGRAAGSGGATTAGSGGRGGGSGGAVVAGTGGRPAAGTGGAGGVPPRIDLNGKKALIIVDNPSSLDDGDTDLRDALIIRGMTVTFGPVTGPASIATGQAVVLGSGSASAADFATTFKDVAVPMIVFGNSYYQPMGMVPTGSSNRGSIDGQTQLTILDGATPLAGGLAMGSTLVVINPERSTQIHWGIPGGSAIKVAGIVGMTTELSAFAFEKGAAMAVGTAAARRVALGWRNNVIRDLTIEPYKLMSAAFEWTAGAP